MAGSNGLSGGMAIFPYPGMTLGVHSVAAAYSGDGAFLPSSTVLPHSVGATLCDIDADGSMTASDLTAIL